MRAGLLPAVILSGKRRTWNTAVSVSWMVLLWATFSIISRKPGLVRIGWHVKRHKGRAHEERSHHGDDGCEAGAPADGTGSRRSDRILRCRGHTGVGGRGQAPRQGAQRD